MDLTKLFAEMRKRENFTSGEGATEEDIQKVETVIDVLFPDSYRQFLRTFSYAWWFGGCVYGIAPGTRWDVVAQTLRAREDELPKGFRPIPRDASVIDLYSGGGYYALYSKQSRKAGRIELLSIETRYKAADEWPSFTDYLEYLLE